MRRLGGIEEIVEGTEEHEEPWNVDGERLEMELGGLEAWRLGGLEAWRLGGLEAWRLGGLEAWRLGGLEAWRAWRH
jgi:hypothetical protein